ncbi:MAG TPA: CHAD domain-containing protein [Bryobacteraceae bacterium]|nr:CHAD domain-containing protein [Bryobacteraceae bacterium]
MDIGRYAREQAANLLARFAFEVRRAVKSHDASSIHGLRITGRRFDEALLLFAPFFPEKELRKVRKRLRRLMELAGNVRNHDVVLVLAKSLGLTAEDSAVRKLRETRSDAARNLGTLLKKFVRRDFSSRWRGRLDLIDPEPARGKAVQVTVAKSARSALPLATGRFFEAGRKAFASGGSADELHEFRLAAKSFRYSLELFQPIYGPAMARRLESLRQLQKLLGDINDCVVAKEMLIEAGALTNKRLLARLAQLKLARVAAFGHYWTEVIDADGQQRSWIVYLSQFAGRRHSRLVMSTHG